MRKKVTLCRARRGYIVKKHLFAKAFLTISAVSCFAFGTAACADGEGNKYDYLVTFDYNVGALAEDCADQYLGVKEGGRVAIQPGYNESFKEQTVTGYYNEGWYLAQTDAEGNPVVGDDERVSLGKKWDFAADTVTENITLYANLVQKPTLTIIGGDETIVWDALPGATRRRPSSSLQPKKEKATFYGYFVDEQYTTPFVWESNEAYTYEAGVHTTVYARFLEGTWSIVKTAAEFNSALSGTNNIYVDDDLDFSQTAFVAGKEFGGEINGNNHTLTGIACTFNGTKNRNENFGLFGTLKATANLHDFTVANAEVTFGCTFANPNYTAALFAWKIEQNAKVTNVTVSGTVQKGTMEQGSAVELSAMCSVNGGAVITGCNFSGVTVVADSVD